MEIFKVMGLILLPKVVLLIGQHHKVIVVLMA